MISQIAHIIPRWVTLGVAATVPTEHVVRVGFDYIGLGEILLLVLTAVLTWLKTRPKN